MSRIDPKTGGSRRDDGGTRDASPFDIACIYDTLRAIARRERARNPSRTLDTTVLIHEAWLKLGRGQQWSDEKHCLASYAIAIRQVLVDYIRHRCADKRTNNPDFQRFYIQQLGERSAEEMLELDLALTQLEAVDPRLVRLVELRFFLGLSGAEAAGQLNISERTATRDWRRARAFLQVSRHATV